MLDLWLNTVYNDPHVLGSDIGPVVYLRNGTGCPLVSYAELAVRCRASQRLLQADTSKEWPGGAICS